MDLKDMEYFCAIVEEGQISKAARKLHISQPPLSLRLKEMESEMGCTLILRTQGQWKVTAQGQALYNECQRILTHVQGLAQTVKNSAETLRGIVRIGLGSHCVSFFRKIFPELLEKFPEISCRAVVADSPTVEKHLQDRTVEIAILRLNLSRNNYTLYNLPKQKMVAVFSPLLRDKTPMQPNLSFEELTKHPLLFSRRWANSEGFRPIIAAFQEKKLKPQIALDTQMPSLLLELLQNSPAVAIMPDTELPPSLDPGYAVRGIEHYVIFQPVIAHLSDSYLSPQAQAVLELLKALCPAEA